MRTMGTKNKNGPGDEVDRKSYDAREQKSYDAGKHAHAMRTPSVIQDCAAPRP